MIEYKIEALCQSGRWLTVGGTRIYRDWNVAVSKYLDLSIERPNDKFRIVWRSVTPWDECHI